MTACWSIYDNWVLFMLAQMFVGSSMNNNIVNLTSFASTSSRRTELVCETWGLGAKIGQAVEGWRG